MNCKPCAWFHKPKSCENGKECRHCHLCPEREIQNRRKAKQAILRHQKELEAPYMGGILPGLEEQAFHNWPVPGTLEMQMQMAQWGEMQWMAQQMQQDQGDGSPWPADYSPVSWMSPLSPMAIPMDGEREEQRMDGEGLPMELPLLDQVEKSPKVALDLATSLTPLNCKLAEESRVRAGALEGSAGTGSIGSPRVVKISQMLCA